MNITGLVALIRFAKQEGMIAPKVGHMDVELLITSAGPSRYDYIYE